MKNPDIPHLRKLVSVFLFCIFNTVAFSQNLIIERGIPKDSRYTAKSNFNKQDYTLNYDKDNQKIYQKKPLENSSQSNKSNVTLTINAVEGESGPIAVSVYNENGDLYFPTTMPGATSVPVSLPAGIYDVFLGYIRNEKDYVVIKEKINVESDTIITVSPYEATNHIVSKIYNQSGELLEPGLFNPETGEVTGGNSVYSIGQFRISYNYANLNLAGIGVAWSFKYDENEDPAHSFYINNVSNRYSVVTSIFGIGQDDNLYFSKLEKLDGVTGSLTLQNNPQDYIFHSQKIKPSVLAAENNAASYGFLTLDTSVDNYAISGWSVFSNSNMVNSDEKMKFYLNNPISNTYDFLVYPALLEAVVDGQQLIGMGSSHISKGNNGNVVFGSLGGSLPNYYLFLVDSTYFDGGIGYRVLPQHSRFSFSSTEEIIPGNNTPINVSAFSPFIENKLESNFIGRFAEKRETDFITTVMEVKQNNTTVYAGDYAGFSNYSFESGKYDVVFTNTNISVDDMSGKNTTKISFDKNNQDYFPPTLQHLQFRDTNNNVTDRFASASEGTVRLAAGDFKFNTDDLGYISYDYVPGNTVHFYYSKHDQNNWTEIPLTNYPEHFQMPAFGDYYEASLSSIQETGSNVWYDAKIICTDAAGNKQEQIISPAFKINSTMAVNDVKKENFTLYPNPVKDLLHFSEEVSDIKITDMSGRMVRAFTTSSKNVNASGLAKGSYIITATVRSGKTVSKKFIKE